MSSWNLQTTFSRSTNVAFVSCCYGNGVWVAVGRTSALSIVYSFNGINGWTNATLPTFTGGVEWNSVCYGGGKFVAVSLYLSSGATNPGYSTVYSTDGINWNLSTIITGDTASWASVCYGLVSEVGRFVAIGNSVSMYSVDGITWTRSATSELSLFGSIVAYGNNWFVANSSSINAFFTSIDGTSWTQRLPTVTDTINTSQALSGSALCFGNGKFVILSNGSGLSTSDPTGLWTKNTLPNSYVWSSVCYGNGKYIGVAIDKTNSSSVISADGITWTTLVTPLVTPVANTPNWKSIGYGNGLFVAVSPSPTFTNYRLMTLIDDSVCYLMGTNILCFIDNVEIYIPIENIRKGTLVKTYNHGYIPVKLIGKRNMINDPSMSHNCLYKMKETGLTITGGHFILVDELPQSLKLKYDFYNENHKIEDKYILIACDSDLFDPVINRNEYTVYHLCLESESNTNHYGIYAEGVLSESTSENDYNDGFFENTG